MTRRRLFLLSIAAAMAIASFARGEPVTQPSHADPGGPWRIHGHRVDGLSIAGMADRDAAG